MTDPRIQISENLEILGNKYSHLKIEDLPLKKSL